MHSRAGRTSQCGAALLLALLLIAFLGAATAALAPLAAVERAMSAAAREAAECRYAAQAIVVYAITELQVRDSWDSALDGTHPSAVVDTTRVPTLAGPRQLDLEGLGASIPPPTPGAWGADRPVWTLFAWGPARALARGMLDSSVYVAVWAADDEGDGDGNPFRDSNGRVMLRGEAFGPLRGRRSVLAVVGRAAPAPASLRLLDWRLQ